MNAASSLARKHTAEATSAEVPRRPSGWRAAHSASYRPDAILRWDGQQLTTHFADPQAMVVAAPANLAYFGPDLDRMVASNLHGHTLVELNTEEPGIALHYPIIA